MLLMQAVMIQSCGPNGSWLSERAKPASPVNLLNGLVHKWSEEKQFCPFPRLNVWMFTFRMCFGVCRACRSYRPHTETSPSSLQMKRNYFPPPNENNIHHELNDPVHPWYILESCGLILARLSVMRHYVEWCDVIQQSIQHFHFKSVW